MAIAFRDHEGFQRAAIGMTAMGAVAGALGSALGVTAIAAGAVGATLGAAIMERPRRAGRIGLALVMSSIGAAIANAVGGPAASAVPSAAPWILGAAIAIALARGSSARAWLGTAAVGTVIGAIGVLAASRVGAAALTATWPAWSVAAVAAAVMALTCANALVTARIAIEIDPIARALRQLPEQTDAELRDLAHQGARVWTEVKARVADEGGRSLVRDGVLRLVEVAAKSDKIPADVAADTAKVVARIDELDGRIAAATDEIARAQYGEARAALDDQRRYLEGIAVSRDRLVARMHNYLAALEKYRLCVIHVETASTAELEMSGKALAELEAAA